MRSSDTLLASLDEEARAARGYISLLLASVESWHETRSPRLLDDVKEALHLKGSLVSKYLDE